MIYLASPYSHAFPEIRHDRFKDAVWKACELIESGLIVFSPIAYCHYMAANSGRGSNHMGWEFWKKFDESMLDKSSLLLVYKIDGWEESVGIKCEVAYAKKKNIPIAYLEYEKKEEV